MPYKRKKLNYDKSQSKDTFAHLQDQLFI